MIGRSRRPLVHGAWCARRGAAYFTAVYADTAVAPACVSCHNAHKDSPRNDFELGETMGGGVIRIPLG